MANIPFNRPYMGLGEEKYVLDALRSRAHCGNRKYGELCCNWLRRQYGLHEVFLTPSCTSALEMGAMLAGIKPGDEVILPSYTFSSTANAIVLRGARPVFCEVTADAMNIDVSRIESLIGPRTRMILPIDYAGIPCDLVAIRSIAKRHGLIVMEDAAQSQHSFLDGKACGSQPDLAAYSFHETKNFTCGEGGALIVNRPEWVERAHFLQEKGTDRSLVLKGVKSKYWWVSEGSSFLLADILAAMLLAQLEAADAITSMRGAVVSAYQDLFAPYVRARLVRLPCPPAHARLNHHACFVLFDTEANQQQFLSALRLRGVNAYIGYMPLHASPMGATFGYKPEDLPVTQDLASRIVRLPLYADLKGPDLDHTLSSMKAVMKDLYGQ
jgi:dTDP-4-amino-4,6-dideoxygalactose transaminase